MAKQTVSFRIETEILDLVKEGATKEGITKTAFIENTLRKGLGYPPRNTLVPSINERFAAVRHRIELIEIKLGIEAEKRDAPPGTFSLGASSSLGGSKAS